MAITRKLFLLRTGAAATAFVATSLAGSSTAQAGPQPHLRSVMALLENAARQLGQIQWPPGPCRPETTAQLTAIIASSAEVTRLANEQLASCSRG